MRAGEAVRGPGRAATCATRDGRGAVFFLDKGEAGANAARMASWNRYNDYGNFRPYVSVAQRRAKAAKHASKLAKGGVKLSPVALAGRKIATTFWGKAWCAHLESFSDYANRLPRGRTYVRNGSVIDLQITAGKITAQVMGSELYEETITIAPLAAKRWAAIKAECAGKIDSLVGLLQGRLSDAVMRVITDRETGLFPPPAEIKLGCSCPDWADMCKHVAAVLYGVGARLDAQPELLFTLRGVDHLELLGAAADSAVLAAGAGGGTGALGAAELAEVFGIEIEASAPVVAAVAKGPASGVTKTTAGARKVATKGSAVSRTKDGTKAKLPGKSAKGKSKAPRKIGAAGKSPKVGKRGRVGR